MSSFKETIDTCGVSKSTLRIWAKASTEALESARRKIETMDANPWVFLGDERHFWQFATETDKAAKAALTLEEHDALLGSDWNDDGWGED